MEVAPRLESLSFRSFETVPLNNATLLSRIRYYRRLPDFESLRDRHGGVREAVRYLKENAGTAEDPFDLIPS